MLSEGSGTSPSGANPESATRSWLDARRMDPAILETIVRVVALACLWVLLVAASTISGLVGS